MARSRTGRRSNLEATFGKSRKLWGRTRGVDDAEWVERSQVRTSDNGKKIAGSKMQLKYKGYAELKSLLALRSRFRSSLGLLRLGVLLLLLRLSHTRSVMDSARQSETLTFRFLMSAGSFGLTVKKPSRRPCCFAFSRRRSLSAPFRTRSSLFGKAASQSRQQMERGKDEREAILRHKELDQSRHIRSFPNELQTETNQLRHSTTSNDAGVPRIPTQE